MSARANREDVAELLREGTALSKRIAKLRKLHASRVEGEQVTEVWRIVRLVAAAALVEHARLLGEDVTDRERELVDAGGTPWRDLIVLSSDGETDAPAPPAATHRRGSSNEAPRLHLMQGDDAQLYLAVPLTLDITHLPSKGA